MAGHSPEMAQVPGNQALVHGQQLVTEATIILFTLAMSSCHAQISNCCSILCLIEKDRSFSRGCGIPARSGVCQRKELAGTWLQVAKVWVLLL